MRLLNILSSLTVLLFSVHLSCGMKEPKAQKLTKLAISNLAERLGIPESRITVLNVKAIEWPDTSLGCPEPGMRYAQVITPGFRIELKVGEKTFVYHADGSSRVVLCEDGEKRKPAPGRPVTPS